MVNDPKSGAGTAIRFPTGGDGDSSDDVIVVEDTPRSPPTNKFLSFKIELWVVIFCCYFRFCMLHVLCPLSVRMPNSKVKCSSHMRVDMPVSNAIPNC